MNDVIQCPICLDTIDTEQTYTLPECNCTFHTACILQWFRHGKTDCPTCRNKGTTVNNTIQSNRNGYYGFTRGPDISLARKFAKKNPDHEINKLLERLKKEEKSNREIHNEIQTLKNSAGVYRELNKELTSLNRKKWKKNCKIRSIKNNIINIYPVTNIIVVTKKEISC